MSANIEQARVEVAKTPQVIIYGHSWLFYWWPVWVLGYVMALLTWLHPVGVQIGNFSVLVSSSTILGVIYALVILLTILITNTKMRGVTSLVVVLVIGFLALTIGVSRVIVGAHYPSDVAAGLLLGLWTSVMMAFVFARYARLFYLGAGGWPLVGRNDPSQ